MPRGKRSLSRRGCLSCKKLKIKCDEVKPSCEYCTHTGRQCVYPDAIPGETVPTRKKLTRIQTKTKTRSRTPGTPHLSIPDSRSLNGTNENWPIASIAESYEASINGNTQDHTEFLDDDLFADHVLSPRPYNSMSTQLHMTRFELRLLRFFHDQCVPYVTMNSNKKATHIWRTVFPKYFASSNLVRQSTYAMACLNLWPNTNLPHLLESDNSECGFQMLPSNMSQSKVQFSHVFDNLSIFENSNESIFSITTSYFIATLQSTQKFAADGQHPKDLTYDDLAKIYFSGYFIFAYAGIHPHCVLPLIEHDAENPADFVGFFARMRRVFMDAAPGMREMIISTLIEYDFLVPTSTSEKIGVVEVLRDQLSTYHFANTTFSEIGAQMCAENETLKNCLRLLESCYLCTLKEEHPTPFFKFLALLEDDFIELARARHYFALRILFNFSCICIFCQFYLSFNENVWVQYVETFVQNFSPLCDSDAALYDHVITKQISADPNRFAYEMRALNRLAFSFGHKEGPVDTV